MHSSHPAGLTTWQLVMLALGTVVGGSFFLGTEVVLRNAGTGALLAFAFGGLIIYLVLMALSELTVSRPVHGSFRAYAEDAFGPMASFVVGWLYWAGLTLALSSEGIAAAMFARVWLPGVPIWLIAGSVVVAVTLLNLLDVRAFAVIESVTAAIKLAAIAALILLGIALVSGLVRTGGGAPAPVALTTHPFLPRGGAGLAGSMLIVLFAYAGFEVLGFAAPEAKDPQRTVPRAVLLTVIGLVTLYMGAVAAVLALLPPGGLEHEVSPMVLMLRHTGFPGLATGLNLIVMTAALSTMLAAVYGLSRMLFSLATEGQAPGFLKKLVAPGVPRNAILFSGGGMMVGVVLSFLLPRAVYIFLVSSAGFALLFSYLVILASQFVIRRREGCRSGACAVPFFPWSTGLGIILLIGAIAGMPLVPGQAAGLLAGLGMLAFISLAYLVVRRPEPVEPEERPDDRIPLA